MENHQKSPTETVREALAALKSCIQSGEAWTGEMQQAYDGAREATDSLLEEGWRNAVGYLSGAPSKTSYVAGVPERTGADVLWRELTIARQRGVTGKEPDTRVEMLERFAPKEGEVIETVHRLMNERSDMTGAHSVVRFVVQALLYGPEAALKSS